MISFLSAFHEIVVACLRQKRAEVWSNFDALTISYSGNDSTFPTETSFEIEAQGLVQQFTGCHYFRPKNRLNDVQ
jgi:hypothetical protein